jgi:hypothetical protein
VFTRRSDTAGRAVVAAAVFGSWLWQYGLMGSEFDADTSIATAVALRPVAATSLYVWGQNRQGMAVPLIAHALHAVLGVPTHETVQLLFYFIAALGLFFAMGLLDSWPFRLVLAVLFAWPSAAMAQSLCNKYLLPAAFLLAIGQVFAFRAAARDPTPLRLAWAAMLAGFLFWIAENCLVLFPAELWVVALALFRSKGAGIWKKGAAALAGVALPAAIIAYGKHTMHAPGVWGLVGPSRALSVAASLTPQLRDLVPALGGGGLYLVVVVSFVWAATELWLLHRGKLENVTALALLGTAPLLGLVGTSFSHHFEENLRLPRYLTWPALIAMVAGCLILDRLAARARRPAPAQAGAWALAMAMGIGSFLGRFPGHGPELEAHWRHKLKVAETLGCQGVIGNHWDVYPFMDLSEGRILASPVGPAAGLVNSSLAFDTVRQHEVCRVRTQRPDPGPCQPTETYFGSGLRLLDEVDEKVDEEQLHFCRFAPGS